jgi:ketosteroid isomerase-like protein
MERMSRRSVLTTGGAAVALAAGGWVDVAGARSIGGRRAVRVADAFYRALQAKDLEAFAALWARDAVWRAPITPEGGPGKTVGREAIVELLRGAFEVFGDVRFTWRLERMRDPRRALANWRLDNELVAGGRYRNQGVAIFTVRRGRIVEFEEHFDTAAWLETFG